MKTRKRSRGTRGKRGSGKWFTQPVRRYTGYEFGPSTSKLARYIHTLFETNLTHEEKIHLLRGILERNKKVNQGNLIKNLKDLGMDAHGKDMREIEAELELTLPTKKHELTYNQ